MKTRFAAKMRLAVALGATAVAAAMAFGFDYRDTEGWQYGKDNCGINQCTKFDCCADCCFFKFAHQNLDQYEYCRAFCAVQFPLPPAGN